MRAWELKEETNVYYHGSMRYLPVGTILVPSMDYEDSWGDADFYGPLEHYRPEGMLAHKDAVFMVGDDDDLDLAGSGTEWVFIVKPLGIIQKHDLNWSSEVSMLVSDGYDINSDNIRNAAENYWRGTPHPNESVWEYLTPKAKIVAVEEY